MGSALASGGSILEPAGAGSAGLGGRFWQLLTEVTRVAPCYQNLAMLTQYFRGIPGELLQVVLLKSGFFEHGFLLYLQSSLCFGIGKCLFFV